MFLQAPHAALKQAVTPVIINSDVSYTIEKMKQSIKGRGVAGLAANQIGIDQQIIFVFSSAYTGYLINPIITHKSGNLKKSREGCLSLEGHKLITVLRDRKIIVEGFTSDWQPIKIHANNQSAFVFQHEIDHLNGITLLNYK